MRIALLSAEYPPAPGGVGDYTRQLGLALVGRGFKVNVFTTHDSRFTVYDLNDGSGNVVGSAAMSRKTAWGWQSWQQVDAAVASVQPDLLHIQYQTGAYGMHPAINFLPWHMQRRTQHPPIVVTAHDLLEPYLFPKAGPLRGYVTRRLICDTDAVVVTNSTDLQQVLAMSSSRSQPAQLIPIGTNIAVNPPATFDRTALRARLGVSEGDTLVAYFGLMGSSKGVDTLVTALAHLSPTFQLVIIGGEASAPQDRAYAEAVRAQIIALGLTKRVTITGQLDETAVSAHLLAADMVALPFSDGATFRRGSLLAALAHGLPVMTTAGGQGSGIGGQEPSLEDGENVLLVPPADANALAAAITRLADDGALRTRLGVAGAALAAQFSWERIADMHAGLYELLWGSSGSTR